MSKFQEYMEAKGSDINKEADKIYDKANSEHKEWWRDTDDMEDEADIADYIFDKLVAEYLDDEYDTPLADKIYEKIMDGVT